MGKRFLRLYDRNNVLCEPITNFTNLLLTQEINVLDSINFNVSGDSAANIELEGYIVTEDGRFVIKEKNEDAEGNYEIYAVAAVEAIKGSVNKKISKKQTYLSEYMDDVTLNTGWTHNIHFSSTKRRKIEMEWYTRFELLQEIISLFNIEVKFDTINKVIHVYNFEGLGTNRGAYFKEGVNLNSFEIESNSEDFVTRLYPVGKDGLRIADANDGVNYIENNTYSTKRISAYWTDERYTDANSLLEAGKERLAELAKPAITYQLTVADLHQFYKDYNNLFQFEIGDSLLVKKGNTQIQQRVVKLVRNYDNPEETEIELSSRSKNLAIREADRARILKNMNLNINSSMENVENIGGTVVDITDKVDTLEQQNKDIQNSIDTLEDLAKKDSFTTAYVQGNKLTSATTIYHFRIGDYILKQIKESKYDKQNKGNYFTNGQFKSLADLGFTKVQEGVQTIFRLLNNTEASKSYNISLRDTAVSPYTYTVPADMDIARITYHGNFAMDYDGLVKPEVSLALTSGTTDSSWTINLMDRAESADESFYTEFTKDADLTVTSGQVLILNPTATLSITLPPQSALTMIQPIFNVSVASKDIDFKDTRTLTFFFAPQDYS